VTASAYFERSKQPEQIHLTELGVALPRAGARIDSTKGGESHMPFNYLYAYLQTRLQREEGQTMAEYGVVLGVITIATVAAFLFLGGEISKVLTVVTSRFDG
jgi:Flp pilus assembly pilin Flp